MNRNQEYLELVRELEELHAPAGSVERALRRERRERRGKYLLRPLMGLAAAFAVFVLLVNLSPSVAEACSRVPVLRDLAEAVSFSRSLSDAVEHDYYQEVGQSQTVNGVTLSVDYVIVDRKSVTVLFRIEGPGSEYMYMDPEFRLADGSKPQYFYHWSTGNGTVEFSDRDIPGTLLMTAQVIDYSTEPGTQIGPYEFRLEFDPNFTAQGLHCEANQTLELDGQQLRITGIDVYPSYLGFDVEGAPENSNWVTGLDFYVLSDDGTSFQKDSTGVNAIYNRNSPDLDSIRTESVYFHKTERVTLCVTGARWVDKNAAEILVDLEKGPAAALPPRVEFVRSVRSGSGWEITVLQSGEQNQCFQMTCYDPAGVEHTLEIRSYGENDPGDPLGENAPEGSGYWSFVLEDYPWSEVRLIPTYTAESSFPEPVTASFNLHP